jgi:5S rRNA maturation endonuclease (ribonuclease M5)
MPNRLGCIVEGPDDRDVLTRILQKLGLPCEIRNARGSGNLKRKLNSYIDLLRSSSCKKIIILRDMDCQDHKALSREFAGYVTKDTKFCLAVHELETWLLADHNALSEVIHRRIRPISNPENIHDAKSKMKEIFQKSERTYIPSRDLPEIAEHLNLSVVRGKCASYRRFETLAKDC